jgi:hypothetical protein
MAEPLHPADRGPFLDRVAERLRGIELIGDGLINRIARETQREFFRAAELARRSALGMSAAFKCDACVAFAADARLTNATPRVAFAAAPAL